MMETLTIEQAYNNLKAVCDNYVGKKAEHIALEASLQKIAAVLFTPEKPKTNDNITDQGSASGKA